MNHRVEVDADLADLIPVFLANRERDLENLHTALLDQDLTRIGKIAHNLKGVAGSYGFEAMAGLGINLQDAVNNGDNAGIARRLEELASYLRGLQVVYR